MGEAGRGLQNLDNSEGRFSAPILSPFPTRGKGIYSNRVINELASCNDISKIEISSSKYSNGKYKFIGLRATHNYGPNPDFRYKIGLWQYYDPNGDLKKEIMYDLTEHILDQASTH